MSTEVINNMPTKIFSLGGIEAPGKNMYVFEHEDEIWVVDSGYTFGIGDMVKSLGFDAGICGFEYLKANESKIKGMIVTHGHLDHIGGIAFLLEEIKLPKIYCGKFAKGLIENSLSEHKKANKPDFEVVDAATVVKTKHFEINFFGVKHSIPNSFGVCFSTVNGNAVYTGDYRFDFEDDNDATDFWKIVEIGKKGVDVMLTETTNAETPGFNTSETIIYKNIEHEIRIAKGRIFLTAFASSMDRIQKLLELAEKYGRKIVVTGRSMINNIDLARKLGMLTIKTSSLVDPKMADQFNDEELFFITTGNQGEDKGALMLMATNSHSTLSLKPTDTIIFSSNPIPGNFLQVERLLNKLSYTGAKVVIHTPENPTHSSGHALTQEIQLMISLLKPKNIVPVHGEFKMQKALVRLAKKLGYKDEQLPILVNGQIIEILPEHQVKITDEFIPISVQYIQNGILAKDVENLIKERETMSTNGVISISLVFDKQKKFIISPHVSVRGAFSAMNNLPLLKDISSTIGKKINTYFSETKDQIKDSKIIDIATNTALSMVANEKKLKPLVSTTIFNIDK